MGYSPAKLLLYYREAERADNRARADRIEDLAISRSNARAELVRRLRGEA
jgi:uncharacterized protein YjiS (DUF1127 family)